jgi:hypothetical protein
MNAIPLFHRLDDYLKGWLTVGCLIALEIALVYLLSNIPFILTTLESRTQDGFMLTYAHVLSDEIHKGQLLAFVCALIAPVVFWSLTEFRKAVMTKILSLSAFFLLMLTAYLHGKGDEFAFLTSFGLYKAALFVWVISIISNRIPPDRAAYSRTVADQEKSFVELTRKG